MSTSHSATEGSQEPEIILGNEYAVVKIRRVHTHNGMRLEISAPHLGRSIRLCPLELESLTWQTPETFSRFLETPFGPEGSPEKSQEAR